MKTLKIKSIRQIEKDTVYDIQVEDAHHFILGNGVVTHNSMDQYTPKSMSGGSGPLYSASVVLMLSKGVLRAEDDNSSDEEGKTKTGVKVRCDTDKNRIAKPEKIEIHISFHKGMNPYVGLQDYLSWKNCGIERGNKLTDKEFSKLKGVEAELCSEFKIGDDIFYFLPKASARNFINKWNGDVIPWREIFTDRVFTDAVIDELDKNVIQPKFKYSSLADVEAAEFDELNDIEYSDDESNN